MRGIRRENARLGVGAIRLPGARDGGEGQREKIQNGQKGHKRFEGEGVAECNIGKGGLDCTVEVYMSEESEERVTVLRVGTQQGAALRLRAAKSSEFGEGEL